MNLYNVFMSNSGPSKINTIKKIREIYTLGLFEAKQIADKAGELLEPGCEWDRVVFLHEEFKGIASLTYFLIDMAPIIVTATFPKVNPLTDLSFNEKLMLRNTLRVFYKKFNSDALQAAGITMNWELANKTEAILTNDLVEAVK